MKSLKIQQPEYDLETKETVSSYLIDKLYRLAQTMPSIVLEGNITAKFAYEDAVNYLNSHFENLHVSADDWYLRFIDPIFEKQCLEAYSADGIGVSVTDLKRVTNLSDVFNDKNISTLEDLGKFEGSDYKGDYLYSFDIYADEILDTPGYTSAGIKDRITVNPNGIDIIFPKASLALNSGNEMGSHVIGLGGNGRRFGKSEFSQYKTKMLINSADCSNCRFSNSHGNSYAPIIYRNCEFVNGWDDKIVPDMTDMSQINLFNGCIIDKVIYREGIINVGGGFEYCSVNNVVYPSTIEHLGTFMRNYRRDAGTTNSGAVVVKAVNPPLVTFNTVDYWNAPEFIYVPDNSVNAYQNASGMWQEEGIKDRIKKMSEMPRLLREELGITDADINRR